MNLFEKIARRQNCNQFSESFWSWLQCAHQLCHYYNTKIRLCAQRIRVCKFLRFIWNHIPSMGQQNYIRYVYITYVCGMSSEEYFFPWVKVSDSILAAGVLLAAVQSQSTSVECAPKLKPINFREKCCNHLILQLSPVQSTIQSSSWIEYHHHNPLCKNPKASHISLVLL